MTPNLEELRRAAEKALEARGFDVHLEADDAFIAQANPAAILSLLDRLQLVEGERESWKQVAEMNATAGSFNSRHAESNLARAETAEAECERLRAALTNIVAHCNVTDEEFVSQGPAKALYKVRRAIGYAREALTPTLPIGEPGSVAKALEVLDSIDGSYDVDLQRNAGHDPSKADEVQFNLFRSELRQIRHALASTPNTEA